MGQFDNSYPASLNAPLVVTDPSTGKTMTFGPGGTDSQLEVSNLVIDEGLQMPGGICSVYNDQTLAGIGLAAIVALVEQNNQTAAGTNQFYAVPASGPCLFKVDFVLQTFAAGTAGTITIAINWTDVNGNVQTTSSTTGTITAITSASGSKLLWAQNNTNIGFTITFNGVTGSPSYYFMVSVVALNMSIP